MRLSGASQLRPITRGGGIAVLSAAGATAARDDRLPRGARACAASTGQLNGATTSEDNPCQD
jgi:hypothetical protein